MPGASDCPHSRQTQHQVRPQEVEETSADGGAGTTGGVPRKIIDLDEFAGPDAATAATAKPPGPLPPPGCASAQKLRRWAPHRCHQIEALTHTRRPLHVSGSASTSRCCHRTELRSLPVRPFTLPSHVGHAFSLCALRRTTGPVCSVAPVLASNGFGLAAAAEEDDYDAEEGDGATQFDGGALFQHFVPQPCFVLWCSIKAIAHCRLSAVSGNCMSSAIAMDRQPSGASSGCMTTFVQCPQHIPAWTQVCCCR